MKKLISFIILFLTFFGIKVFATTTPELYVVSAYPVSNNMFEIVFSNGISNDAINSEKTLFEIESLNTSNARTFSVNSIEISNDDEKNIVKVALNDRFVYGESYKVKVLNILDVY
ncbi:MAG: hypothetical protein LBQ59_02280 [Candidatus Peribacteria bacterium]|jgi:hypothetical protein|nr:hypothetical protein [Candidatus Peribacteria bacterium]